MRRESKEREQCPDCPDGYVWTTSGPTDKECPTCLGLAYVEKKPEPLTIFMCGPSKCEHDYSKWEDIVEDGKVRGGTAVCAKCGTSAIAEAAWD